jgi:predicted alpha/beta-fold hydrolase
MGRKPIAARRPEPEEKARLDALLKSARATKHPSFPHTLFTHPWLAREQALPCERARVCNCSAQDSAYASHHQPHHLHRCIGRRTCRPLRQAGRKPRACALFAHCFTCSKDVFAAKRIASELAAHGIATLRFDFTGLGHSDGDFASTNFSSNVADLISAVDWMRENDQAPAILIGHSLGGAAVLSAAAGHP